MAGDLSSRSATSCWPASPRCATASAPRSRTAWTRPSRRSTPRRRAQGGRAVALDAYGAALDAALGLLEKGLLLAVDVYAKAVEGALKFAEGVVKAFGVFAALVKDIARDPRKWLTYLGRSAKDGVKNHLWKAFKLAVKRWFNQKLEEVLGLGLAVWNVLKKGGIPLAKIGTMVWEALKVVIPTDADPDRDREAGLDDHPRRRRRS